MGVPKKNLKATKKFEKKHLKTTLDNRKAGAKIKQRAQVKAKKQLKRTKDAEFFKGGEKEGEAPKKPGRKETNANSADMSVDDFFKGGFEIINQAGPADGKKKPAGKLGKRKRDAPQAEEAGSDSEAASGSNSDLEMDDLADGVSEEANGAFSDEDGDDIGITQGGIDRLKEKDPEFYKYLQENDPDALNFEEDVNLSEIDDLSGSGEEEEEEEEEEEQPKKKKQKKDKKKQKKQAADDSDDEAGQDNELSRAMVARWKKSLTESHSLRAARQVVLAFRAAAHLNDVDDDTSRRYAINSPEVFHDVLVVALKQIPEVLQFHVPVKESASHKTYVQTDSKKFKTLSPLVRSFTASVLHLLTTLSDDATLKLTISALEPLLPYLLSFRKVLKALIKSVVGFWAQPSSSQSTRITAFLVMRRLVVIGDKGVRESVLKAAYQGLISGSRTTSINTIQGINLMKNSAAELWGIDQAIGYTTAFTFIRQLAIHLRNSIVNNQNDSFRKVYNWQYVHSLDFWSTVLAEHCSPLKEAEAGKESQLRLLIYPLVQVTLGAMRLIPTAAYFPLRFQLIRSLLRVSRATGTYIPLASALLEVLNSNEMKKPAKPSTLKQLDFATAYKAPKSYLHTSVYQNGLGEQVCELMAEYFVLWSTNIAFPEFSLPVVIMAKRWMKDARRVKGGNKNNRLVSSLALLVQKIEANARFIEEKRAKVEFAPKDRSQVDAFLKDFEWEKTPVGAFVVGQRKVREERARVNEEARKEEERKRKEVEQEALKGDESGSEPEEEEEDDDAEFEREVEMLEAMEGEQEDEDDE